MKKQLFAGFLSAAVLSLAACGTAQPQGGADLHRIGMLPDAGGVNDQSFNQGTWEGVQRFHSDHPELIEEPTHIVPANTATADFVNSAEQLITAGKELIVMSGFTFQDAVTELQENHPDTKFVIIDAAPDEINDNTLGIFFAEQEAGFLAGIAQHLKPKPAR
ncbi:MAG: BMP family ABC transporter substrate-binding protein [Turicibacter sp.]|nr:BMP family ABC transporter substrate-binding protein [Turicibacter sp.]